MKSFNIMPYNATDSVHQHSCTLLRAASPLSLRIFFDLKCSTLKTKENRYQCLSPALDFPLFQRMQFPICAAL